MREAREARDETPGMLAYVFWHWRRREVPATDYAARLASFHHALARGEPAGLVGSAAFASGPAPWVPDQESYEDWYLIEGSAALDPLNEAAVTGSRKSPHDSVAALAAGGAAGLYRLRHGSPEVVRGRHALWFDKPAGMSYEALWERAGPLVRKQGVGLWGRQMVLGPSPEFCLLSPEPLEPPDGIEGVRRALDPVWPVPATDLSE